MPSQNHFPQANSSEKLFQKPGRREAKTFIKSLFLNFSWYCKQVVVPADASGLVSKEKLLNMMIPNERQNVGELTC
jgi:hypothetical protein